MGTIRDRNSRSGPLEREVVTPREVPIAVAPGTEARGGYFDVCWSENGDYRYHYLEDGIQFRFDREAENAGTDYPV